MLARRLIPLLIVAGSAGFGQAASRLDLDSFEKVWTTVRDKHWQTKPGGLDWQAIHDEYRPRVEKASSQTEALAVMQEMLGRLKQSHFAIIPAAVYSVLDDQAGGPGGTRDRRAGSRRSRRGDQHRSGVSGRKAGRPAGLADPARRRQGDETHHRPGPFRSRHSRAAIDPRGAGAPQRADRRDPRSGVSGRIGKDHRPETGPDRAARQSLDLRESAGGVCVVRRQAYRVDGLCAL